MNPYEIVTDHSTRCEIVGEAGASMATAISRYRNVP